MHTSSAFCNGPSEKFHLVKQNPTYKNTSRLQVIPFQKDLPRIKQDPLLKSLMEFNGNGTNGTYPVLKLI